VSAIEEITAAMSGPGGRLSRTDWHQKVRDLSITWPSLGAALATLLEEHDHSIPGPLRHARNVINQEKK